jgi:sulfide:quinone oxidoreductase
VFAGPEPEITLLTAEPELVPRPMTVATPFGRGGPRTHDWAPIAADQGAHLIVDALVAVDVDRRVAFTRAGRRIPYGDLVLATGARRVEPFAGALTFGTARDCEPDLRGIVADLLARDTASVVFTLPSPAIWPLPLYELAVLTAAELREHGSRSSVRIVTPEAQALELLGPAAREAIAPLLDVLGIELMTCAQPHELVPRGLRLRDGGHVTADHVVTLAYIVARPVPGLPVDRAGFIPVDLHGRVAGEPGVYAVGEVTSFPLRQGGLATQQADAAAAAIAAARGAGNDPQPFTPVLRGRMLTTGAPLYLQSRPSGQSLASPRALWSPPGKVAGRYLAPYLATARPPQIGTAPLVECVPARANAAREDAHDAVRLALAIADAEARSGHPTRELQAREAALALDPAACRPVYEHLRAGPAAATS